MWRPMASRSSCKKTRSSLVAGLFVSATVDQLHAAIDAECGLVSPRGRVPRLIARPGANPRIHDTAALRAVANGRVRPSMIHVVASVRHPEWSHHAPPSLCTSASRRPSRTSAQKRARATLCRLS